MHLQRSSRRQRIESAGATGPDTFSRLIDISTQEMVLRATGGLMTMLTAPGAGTNTETGSAHQDAFDDLAAAEAEEIASVLQESLFAPALDQWHPGQPHLVEFAMRRPDSDNATGTIANVASLATAGYRTDAAQVSDLTGLAVQDTGAPAAAAQPTPGGDFPALRSLHTRFAPTMLYPPARAAFERAINSRLAPSTPSPDASAPLTQAELEALQSLSKGFDPDQLEADADTIYSALSSAISPSEEPDPTAENAKHHSDGTICRAFIGPCTYKGKGGRASKGNPRAKRTKSNTPLKAAPGAKPQAKVDAIDHALRTTLKKGGKVEDVAKIGGKSVTIEHGKPGIKKLDYKRGFGSSHQYAKHGDETKEKTTQRKAAITLVHGKRRWDEEHGTVAHELGSRAAYTRPLKDGKSTFQSAHRKD